MTNNPLELLEQGSKLLEPLLLSHGFAFRLVGSGAGSGGHFATGEFVRGTRRLEMHFRFTLGLVSYHLGAFSMNHVDYMRSVLGRHYASHYPGFSNHPLDGFGHLLLDLEEHCGEFLHATNETLSKRINDALTHSSEGPKLPD